MQKIITITLNPSLDKGTSVKAIVPEKKLLCSNPILEPGGGGINVSRALEHLGCNSTAIFMYGGYTGKKLFEMMMATNIECVAFEINEDTRENLIVVDSSENAQYRFGMKGAALSENEWQNPLAYLENNEGYDFVVASGSLPQGVPLDFFGRVASIVQRKGAKLIIDTSGEALKQAVKVGVFLIKPNLDELCYLNGVEEIKTEDVVIAAKNIIQSGGAEIVVVSMGANGAALVTDKESFQIPSPKVKLKSTVGAGDSMVAGLVLGITRNYEMIDLLKLGIACGSAATMNEGTALCKKEDVEKLFQLLKDRD